AGSWNMAPRAARLLPSAVLARQNGGASDLLLACSGCRSCRAEVGQKLAIHHESAALTDLRATSSTVIGQGHSTIVSDGSSAQFRRIAKGAGDTTVSGVIPGTVLHKMTADLTVTQDMIESKQRTVGGRLQKGILFPYPCRALPVLFTSHLN